MLAKLKVFEIAWLIIFGVCVVTFFYITIQQGIDFAYEWLFLMIISAFFYFRRRKIRKDFSQS